jgi:hypothetical protein
MTQQGSRFNLARFRAEWEPDYIRPEYLDNHWAAMSEIVADYTRSVRLQVTTELLETAFALGDGQRVTWGDATVEQHEQRIRFLTTQAAGTLETASRHQAAIGMIREASAMCLRDLSEDVAA